MLQRLKCARFSLCYQRKNAGAKRESDKRKFLENQAECWRGGVLERWCYRLKVAGCRFKAAQRPEVQEQQQKRQGDEHRLAQEPQCEKNQCENVKEPRLPSPKHISQNALFRVFRVFRGFNFGFRIYFGFRASDSGFLSLSTFHPRHVFGICPQTKQAEKHA